MDWRLASQGCRIPAEFYADQPYIVIADDGAWVCCLTTGAGHEGQSGQHIVTFRSTDAGKTWSDSADVEPSDGPEASYAVMLKNNFGRIYIFYNHNTDHIKQVKADTGPWAPLGYYTRVDSCGHFVFKYSDDNGRTWSGRRYDVPVRAFDCDRNSAEGGRFFYFWNVGRAFSHNGCGYVPLIKVGRMGEGFFSKSEGALLKSANLMSEPDPLNIIWETLPDGDTGLRAPEGGGEISEEQSYVTLSDGTFYCVYRTIDGHPACCYSRDGGHTWSTPQYKKYADGRLFRHPRAANFVWKCRNGKYLYWFHNHGGTWYDDRNPVWISGGIESDSPDGKIIIWSEPEILLYEDDTYLRMSYPDLVEDEGRYFVTETNKTDARVHEIPVDFLCKIWGQFDEPKITRENLLTEWIYPAPPFVMPKLPYFTARDNNRADYGRIDLRAGFTIEIKFAFCGKPLLLLDTRGTDGKGVYLTINNDGSVTFGMNDSRSESLWTSQPGLFVSDEINHLGVTVDGGPKIISFTANGRFADGADDKQFGWGRFSPDLCDVTGTSPAIVPSDGTVELLRVYGRALMISEIVSNRNYESSRSEFDAE